MKNIMELPEDCIAHILSLTSPADVLRCSTVSKNLLSVSNSDLVWANFLPSDCQDIISRSSSSINRNQFPSKKHLFIYLCRFPILFENNTKSFALDKSSGKICYMLGARSLSITWGSSPEYWNWESIPGSRFPNCAVLESVCWLEIRGKIHTTLLSPDTTYGAYFVFNLKDDSEWGGATFEHAPVNVSVSERSEDGLPIQNCHIPEIRRFYLVAPESEMSRERSFRELPVARSDGLLEIEMGRYRVGIDVDDQRAVLEMTLKEIERGNWKSGLIVHGIELRPLM